MKNVILSWCDVVARTYIAQRATIASIAMGKIQKQKCQKIGTRILRYANVKKAQLAAIAFEKNGNIIAHAHNRRIDGHDDKYSVHAEAALINKLNKINAFERFGKISILVMRINSRGISMARPCQKCQKLLLDYDVVVYYTSWSGSIERF